MTYNLLGRIHHAYKHLKDVYKARGYYEKAIIEFKKCEHYRGIYVTLKDLHDLEMKHLLEEEDDVAEIKTANFGFFGKKLAEKVEGGDIKNLELAIRTLYEEHVEH